MNRRSNFPVQSICFLALLLGSLFTLPKPSRAQDPQAQRISFPDPRITVSGLGWWQEEPKLQRFPERMKEVMPPKVWSLSKCTAGVRLRFRTDSTKLGLVAKTGTYKPAPTPPTVLIGVDVYVDDAEKVDLERALATLKELGIDRLMVEGGGTLNFELMRLGLVDEVTAYVAPMIFGGESAPTMAAGSGLERSAAILLQLIDAEKWEDGGVLLKYQFVR